RRSGPRRIQVRFHRDSVNITQRTKDSRVKPKDTVRSRSGVNPPRQKPPRLCRSKISPYSPRIQPLCCQNHCPVVAFSVQLLSSAVQLPRLAVQLSSSLVELSKSSSSYRIHRRVVEFTQNHPPRACQRWV